MSYKADLPVLGDTLVEGGLKAQGPWVTGYICNECRRFCKAGQSRLRRPLTPQTSNIVSSFLLHSYLSMFVNSCQEHVLSGVVDSDWLV